MKCPSCNADDIKGLYCSNCGAKLPQEQEVSYSDSGDIDTIEKGQNAYEEALNQYNSQPKKEVGITRNKIFAFFGILIFLIILVYSCSSSENTQEKEARYQKGIQLIKEEKWDEATVAFINLKDGNYKESKFLYNYASSRESDLKQNYDMARHYLKDIPDTYSGVMHEEILSYKKEIDSQKFKIALDLIRSMKFQDAVSFCDGDESMKPFLNLANALVSLQKGDLNMARSYAENIKDYSGYGSDEVKSYKNTILSETTPEIIKTRKKSEGVRIGMTQEEVLKSNWGKPNHINKTTTANGEHEQWVYGNGNYLYFDGGILTTIQN